MDTRKTIINLLRSTGRKGIENVISLLENSNIHGYRDIDGHGGRSARILKDVCHLELTTDECNAISYHMWKRHKRPVRSKLELAVFDADKSSAKRYCLQDLLSFTEIAKKKIDYVLHIGTHVM